MEGSRTDTVAVTVSELAVSEPQPVFSPSIKASAFSPDGKLFAALGTLGEFSIWEMVYPTKPWDKPRLEMKYLRTWMTHYTEADIKAWISVKILISNRGEYISLVPPLYWNSSYGSKRKEEEKPYFLVNGQRIIPKIDLLADGDFTFVPERHQLAWITRTTGFMGIYYIVELYDVESWVSRGKHRILLADSFKFCESLLLNALHRDSLHWLTHGSKPIVSTYFEFGVGKVVGEISLRDNLSDISQRSEFICGYDKTISKIVVHILLTGLTLVRQLSHNVEKLFVTVEDYIAILDGKKLYLYDPYSLLEYMTLPMGCPTEIISRNLIAIDASDLGNLCAVNIFADAQFQELTRIGRWPEHPNSDYNQNQNDLDRHFADSMRLRLLVDEPSLAAALDDERILLMGAPFTIIRFLKDNSLNCFVDMPTPTECQGNARLVITNEAEDKAKLYLYAAWLDTKGAFHQRFTQPPTFSSREINSFPILHDELKVLNLTDKDFRPTREWNGRVAIRELGKGMPYIFNRLPGSITNLLEKSLEKYPGGDRGGWMLGVLVDMWQSEQWIEVVFPNEPSALKVALEKPQSCVPTMIRSLAVRTRQHGPAFMQSVVENLPRLCKDYSNILRTDIEPKLAYLPFLPFQRDDLPEWSRHKNFQPRLTTTDRLRTFPASLNSATSLFQYIRAYIFEWTFPKDHSHTATLCYLPLPDLCVYPHPTKPQKNLLYRVFAPRSIFSSVMLNGGELFTEPAIIYPIANFKWYSYGRYIWAIIFALNATHFACFSILTSTPPQDFHTPLAYVSTILSSFFLFQELRQMIGHGFGLFGGSKSYFTSVYNHIDLALFGLTLSYALMVIDHSTYGGQLPPSELGSVAQVLFWAYMLLQLRVIRQIGIFIAMLMTIIKRSLPFLVVLAMIILGFAHGLFVYISRFDQTSLLFAGNKMQDDAPNDFGTFPQSLLSVYLFLTSDFSGLDRFQENKLVIVYKSAFIFFSVIVLLNILVAILNNVYNDVVNEGERIWLYEMVILLAEFEVYWMWPALRKNERWFPKYIFYEAYTDKVNEWKDKLNGDTNAASKSEVKELKNLLQNRLQKIEELIERLQK